MKFRLFGLKNATNIGHIWRHILRIKNEIYLRFHNEDELLIKIDRTAQTTKNYPGNNTRYERHLQVELATLITKTIFR